MKIKVEIEGVNPFSTREFYKHIKNVLRFKAREHKIKIRITQL